MISSSFCSSFCTNSIVMLSIKGGQCDNCKRKQFDCSSFYRIEFVEVMSDQIKNSTLYKNVTSSKSSHTARPLHLCSACHTHLKKDVTSEAGGDNQDEDGEQAQRKFSTT